MEKHIFMREDRVQRCTFMIQAAEYDKNDPI